ncbi:hypothetical protein JW826_05240 [Candidatus Woesearchaeota archaeon]|nr:hypothetical protein [Candidatus Woesearchaeota archaeon]
MNLGTKGPKWVLLAAVLALYVSLFWVSFGYADPTGADISLILVDYGPNSTAGSRTDPGGTITTLSIDVTQQDQGWKAYVGNLTGRLVLRDSNSMSIYEWDLASSALGGHVFVSRSNSVNWTPLRCANRTDILAEDTFLGLSSSAADSINNTFNYSIHAAMVVGGTTIGTFAENSCNSTATFVNGSIQEMNVSTTKFQEILLHDNVDLVYATFIDQDSDGFATNSTNNLTYDFQLIVAENKSESTGHTYYFYADIS